MSTVRVKPHRGARPTLRWRAVAGLAVVALSVALPTAVQASAGAAAVSTMGFESDAVGSVPAGCTTPSGYAPAAVSEQRAFEGAHSLELNDESATTQTVVSCPASAQQGAYLSFHAYPAESSNGFVFDIDGDTLAPVNFVDNAVFHFWVQPDGAIDWSDGGTWRSLAPAGTVPTGQWSQIQVAVPADLSASNNTAYVTVDGTYVGSGGPTIGNNHSTYRAITDIDGFGFESDSAAGVGDDVFLDDVVFGDAAATPASAVDTAPFRIGPTSTINDVGQVQDPASEVVVPHDGGKRILAEYSEHPDNSSSSGAGLSYSDDGGATWVDDQASNPLPASSGMFLSLLRNGDVLAVGFHTYLTPGSNDEQAEVDTAISHDDGDTWTVRTGTMTTPVPMRSISTVTDRPGSPLGGFVLVHNVVEDPDGTLYQSAYGYYAGDRRYRQILLVSSDEGQNWTVRSTVASGDAVAPSGPTDGIAEGALSRVADGSLLMILRNGSYQPYLYSRSTDNGLSWSTPQQIAIGAQAQQLYSIYPTLQLLPTGQLVLLAARPGLELTASQDGIGDDWSTPVGIDYANSENAVLAALSPSSLVVLGDQGNASPWRVWSRTVTVDQPCAQTVTGTHDGPLTAGAGGLCLDGATVNGPVTVSGGGRLVVQGSTIHGPVTTTGASLVSLCGSSVSGPVSLSGTTGMVTVGDTLRACDPDTIGGPLSVTGSGGQLVADRSTVGGPVNVTGSTAALATVLDGLIVKGPLACSGNAATPTDSGVPDTVTGPASSQCAALK